MPAPNAQLKLQPQRVSSTMRRNTKNYQNQYCQAYTPEPPVPKTCTQPNPKNTHAKTKLNPSKTKRQLQKTRCRIFCICAIAFAMGGSQPTFTRKGCAELRGVHSPPHRAPTPDLNATKASKSEARSPPIVGTPLDPEPSKGSGSIEPAFGGFDAWGALGLPHAP